MMKLLLVALVGACAMLAEPFTGRKATTQVIGWGFNVSGEATGIRSPATNQMETGVVVIAGEKLTNVTAIAAGYQHSLALRNDGTIVGWGFNNCGQATGVIDGSNGIVTINGAVLTNVVAVSAGLLHSLALIGNGKVTAWGSQTTVPAGLSNVIAISAGCGHSLALKKDGTVVMWPNPIREDWRSPGIITSLTNVVAIAATSRQFGNDMAVKPDGSVVTWDNRSGRSHSISGLSNVVAVAAGREGLALTRDGTVFEINVHSDADPHSDEARQHAGLSNIVAIAAGGLRCLALTREGTVSVVWEGGFSPYLDLPAGLTNVIGIAAGDMFCLALQSNSAGPITNAFPELPKLFGKP